MRASSLYRNGFCDSSVRTSSRRITKIEFRRVGAAVKVSAKVPKALTEVSIVDPAAASEAELTRTVLRKLEYVLATKQDYPRRQRGVVAERYVER